MKESRGFELRYLVPPVGRLEAIHRLKEVGVEKAFKDRLATFRLVTDLKMTISAVQREQTLIKAKQKVFATRENVMTSGEKKELFRLRRKIQRNKGVINTLVGVKKQVEIILRSPRNVEQVTHQLSAVRGQS